MARRSTGAGEQPKQAHAVPRGAQAGVEGRRPAAQARAAHGQGAVRRDQGAGYDGGYSRVTDFIRAWRQGEGQSASANAFVPLAFELGEAFQFDWSEEGLVVGGIYYRMQVSHMKLCASRAFWLVAYPSQGHEMLFDAHTRSFAALGGVARRGIYDNMKTAVDKVKKGKGRIVNERFAVMCAHYLFDAGLLQRRQRLGEGRRREERAGQPPAHLDRRGQAALRQLRELNAWLGERCRALWDEVRHPEHEQFSVAEMLEHERAHLMPMPAPFDGYVEKPARVSSTCLVSVARNRYSVPCELAGQMVSTRLYPGSVVVVANDAHRGQPRAAEQPPARRGTTGSTTSRCCRGSPARCATARRSPTCPSRCSRLRRALLRDPGGDRVMAQVLAIVPSAGLDAVLVAVELALETGPPGQGQRGARGQRAGAAERGADAADGCHAAEGEHTAAGQHGALRQPACRQRHRGGRPCVT
jgi:hypothetical protein